MSLLLLFNQPSVGFQTYTDAFAEALAVSDGVGAKGTYSSALSDTTTLTGMFSAVQVFSAALGDGISLTESYAAKGTFSAALAAQLALADSLILGGVTYTDAFTAQVSLSDGSVVRTVLAASLGEAIAVSSSLGAKQVQVSSLGETLLLNAMFDGARVGLTWPSPADVLLGVQYGPTGADFTGTAAPVAPPAGFASCMTVTLTTERMSVTEKPRKQAQQVVPSAAQRDSTKSKNAYVRTPPMQFQVLTLVDEVWVRTNQETI